MMYASFMCHRINVLSLIVWAGAACAFCAFGCPPRGSGHILVENIPDNNITDLLYPREIVVRVIPKVSEHDLVEGTLVSGYKSLRLSWLENGSDFSWE